jgi:hypothetical protein
LLAGLVSTKLGGKTWVVHLPTPKEGLPSIADVITTLKQFHTTPRGGATAVMFLKEDSWLLTKNKAAAALLKDRKGDGEAYLR